MEAAFFLHVLFAVEFIILCVATVITRGRFKKKNVDIVMGQVLMGGLQKMSLLWYLQIATPVLQLRSWVKENVLLENLPVIYELYLYKKTT